jgi:hypothetical protein
VHVNTRPSGYMPSNFLGRHWSSDMEAFTCSHSRTTAAWTRKVTASRHVRFPSISDFHERLEDVHGNCPVPPHHVICCLLPSYQVPASVDSCSAPQALLHPAAPQQPPPPPLLTSDPAGPCTRRPQTSAWNPQPDSQARFPGVWCLDHSASNQMHRCNEIELKSNDWALPGNRPSCS